MQQDLIARIAELLFVNGQTTQALRLSVLRAGAALGLHAQSRESWGELAIDVEGAPRRTVAAAPTGVDMGKVADTEAVVEALCDGRATAEAAAARLAAISARPPVSLARFALMAAAGAAALGIIFGATHPLTLVLIAFSAGAGVCLRRALARMSANPFVQPLAAALLAGLVGSTAALLGLAVDLRLVIVCPCMVLVPGPHFLNGGIDLARARIPLGAARLAFAFTIVLMISTGLLLGLAAGVGTIPASGAPVAVPLGYDVVAAGVAVAAYGSFYNMPWRLLPLPIVIGMLAHAAHWGLIGAGASVQSAAFFACLFVGGVVTPLADRLRMPFGAFAFAPVVSMIPGVFMFQAASSLIAVVGPDRAMRLDALLDAVTDGTTAFLVLLAMAVGLIAPRMCIERIREHLGRVPRPQSYV